MTHLNLELERLEQRIAPGGVSCGGFQSGGSLTADFTASPLLGTVPLIVQFTGRSTGNPVS